MNYLIVGKNGSGKSYFTVNMIKEFSDKNTVNLAANAIKFEKNNEILLDRDQKNLISQFSETIEKLKLDNVKVYSSYESSQQLLNDIPDHFQSIEDGLNFDHYFKYHLIYNDFIKFVSSNSDLKLELLIPVHKLYADINGLKIEGVELSPEDWRTSPLGSKIFYDEFQDRPEYLFEGNKPSKNPMILELSKIRHYDIDLYLITPDPDNLHKSLRKIVHVMYFVKRPHGNPNCCSIYSFDQFLSNPRAAADSKREPKKYVHYELLTYKKSIQRLYTSAANHSSMKFQIPWKWIRNAFFIFIGFSIIFVMLFKIPIFSTFIGAVKGMFGGDNVLEQLKQAPSSEKTNSVQPQTSSFKPDLTKVKACMEQFKWTEQQCLEAYNPDLVAEKNKQLEQSTGNNMEQIVFKYNASKPFDTEYQVNAQPTDFPKFSGCIKKNGRYVAYTQQGTILKDVSSSDCQRVIENGDRPFDYFKQPQQQQMVQQVDQSQRSVGEQL